MTVTMTKTPALGRLAERVQELQERLDAARPDGANGGGAVAQVADLADELVAAVVQMYGAGLERIMAVLVDRGEPGRQIVAELAGDEGVATLLLIHDLHPVPLAERVQGALDAVRPYMESHGGDVALLGVEHGIARIHLRGSCSDCSASSATLELAIKQALESAAPDLEGLEVSGVTAQTGGGPGLPMATGLPMAGGAPAPTGMELPVVIAAPAPAWHALALGPPDPIASGATRAVMVAGHRLVVANVGGTLLAFRDRCAGCGSSLADGHLQEGALACPSCGRAFFLPRAGRELGDEGLQLEPVPLLHDSDGAGVRVAV